MVDLECGGFFFQRSARTESAPISSRSDQRPHRRPVTARARVIAGMELRRLLREPLLHFIVLGALLFAAYSWVGGAQAPNATIVVDRARVDALSAQFERVWQRAPTPTEKQVLIDAWVREEVLYREGLAAGLDRDDDIVRRRVVQKMTFLNEAMVADVPTDAELEAWLRDHPDDYRVAPRYTLHQVYFDPRQQGGESLTRELAQARARLRRDAHANVGDTAMLPPTLRDASADEVQRTFGSHFARALESLPVGRWSDPVASGFGVHLVRIEVRTPARMPSLAEVRREVERDLLGERTRKASEAFHDTLRKRYTIRIEADLEERAADEARAGASTTASGTR